MTDEMRRKLADLFGAMTKQELKVVGDSFTRFELFSTGDEISGRPGSRATAEAAS